MTCLDAPHCYLDRSNKLLKQIYRSTDYLIFFIPIATCPKNAYGTYSFLSMAKLVNGIME